MLEFFEGFGNEFFTNFIKYDRWKTILSGLGNTVLITLAAILIGLAIGTIIALIKVSYTNSAKPNILLKILNAVATLYLTIIRGTPVLVQLLILYYSILSSGTSSLTAAMIGFGINSGAYVAEVIRGGIQSVDRGQMEAGRSLGLPYRTTMIKIIFPQALKNILPPIGNEFIALLNETSVAGYIGVAELVKSGDSIRNTTYSSYPLYAEAVIYLVIVIILTFLLGVLERRLRKSDKR